MNYSLKHIGSGAMLSEHQGVYTVRHRDSYTCTGDATTAVSMFWHRPAGLWRLLRPLLTANLVPEWANWAALDESGHIILSAARPLADIDGYWLDEQVALTGAVLRIEPRNGVRRQCIPQPAETLVRIVH